MGKQLNDTRAVRAAYDHRVTADQHTPEDTCQWLSAVLINQSACFALRPKHLLEHDAALVTQNAEDAV